MKTTGRFAAWVAEFMDYRRQLGYINIKDPERDLRNLADFMDREASGQPLTDMWVLRWREANAHRSSSILFPLPSFVRWLTLHDPKTSVSKIWLHRPKSQRLTPYIYDPEEVTALMDAARGLNRHEQVFGRHTYAALLGLLASTGLRISESLGLDRDDVDLKGGVLRVRESKGVRLRVIPLHDSTTEALLRYAEKRDHYHRIIQTKAFFVGSYGRRLLYLTFRAAFCALRRKAGVPFRPHPRPPRIHDLRHTFATRYLLRVRGEGSDMHCAVADLSVYLGHCHIAGTYWYLTGIPELMALCGDRFQAYVEARRQGGQP